MISSILKLFFFPNIILYYTLGMIPNIATPYWNTCDRDTADSYKDTWDTGIQGYRNITILEIGYLGYRGYGDTRDTGI